jgi:hypothetical protein
LVFHTLYHPRQKTSGFVESRQTFEEWKVLENLTNRSVKYYTIHGTQRLLARLLWSRKISQSQAMIPNDFPLVSFHDFTTMSLDRERYLLGFDAVSKEAEHWIDDDVVLSLHPEWLFEKNEKTKRGPLYDILKSVLEADEELDTLVVKKKLFFKISHDSQEYEKSINPTEDFLEKIEQRGIDIHTFLDRKWCCPIPSPPSTWKKANDNIALLEIKSYDEWWKAIGKKTRNMIRRAEKSGVKVAVVEPSNKLAEGIWRIYNETPIRQDRAFTHYGESLRTVTENMYAAKNNIFIGAFLADELAGFIQILFGDKIAIVSNILSLQQHWSKALNNALLAKAVEVCASKRECWLMYGRIGNHPSLDRFKANNGFIKFPVTRYYILISWKGRLAAKLGLYRELKDNLPASVKYPLIPVANWISRTKIRVKIALSKSRNR